MFKKILHFLVLSLSMLVLMLAPTVTFAIDTPINSIGGPSSASPSSSPAPSAPTPQAPPTNSSADSRSGGLVPCGHGTPDANGAIPDSDMCHVADFFLLIQNIINWLWIVVIPVAAFSIAIAGAMYILSAASEERRTQAKSILMLVVGGLFLTFAAWLIINTLVRALVNDTVNVPLEETPTSTP